VDGVSSKVTFMPISYTGWNSLEHLVDEAKRLNASNILIVTDPFLEDLGMTKKIVEPLEAEGWTTSVYTEVVPEPPLAVGEKLVAYTREHKFDLVIGLGGGSALDLAKLAGVLATHEGKVADYLNLTGDRSLTHKGIPKILIPTTSGTGSEVTNISVLSLESTKDVVTHDYLLPDVAIVDPTLTIAAKSNCCYRNRCANPCHRGIRFQKRQPCNRCPCFAGYPFDQRIASDSCGGWGK
jgi:alcohol dehydrogenase class IV